MKAGRLGSSFGFLALETSDRGDGVKVIEAIDLFEVITAAPANADTRIISTRSADEYDRIRGEFSRHLYDLLTTPLASESLPSKPDRSKRHAPIVVRPMRLTDAQRSWLSSARASAGRRGCPRPRAAGRTTKVNGPGCGHPSPSLDRGGSGEPESADPAPIAFPNCGYPQRGVVNPPLISRYPHLRWFRRAPRSPPRFVAAEPKGFKTGGRSKREPRTLGDRRVARCPRLRNQRNEPTRSSTEPGRGLTRVMPPTQYRRVAQRKEHECLF
jgi:hypothetical protein